uniref:Uncharacterized protein n=1 Tax=viral metagenome TaxID=1070528 RepID=A0A6M3KIX2_9ZZZZ
MNKEVREQAIQDIAHELRPKLFDSNARYRYATGESYTHAVDNAMSTAEQVHRVITKLGYRLIKPESLADKPAIVCLCGSTRFVDTFNEWRKRLTLDGKIVLSIEIVTTQTKETDPQYSNHEVKAMLDELHLRKIDLADEVMILNVGGYIGESTRKELEYALSLGKPIKYLESSTQRGS